MKRVTPEYDGTNIEAIEPDPIYCVHITHISTGRTEIDYTLLDIIGRCIFCETFFG